MQPSSYAVGGVVWGALTLFVVPRSSQCMYVFWNRLEPSTYEVLVQSGVIDWPWVLFGPDRRTGDGELVGMASRCAACKMDPANGPGEVQLCEIKVVKRCISLRPAYLVTVVHAVTAGGCQTL